MIRTTTADGKITFADESAELSKPELDALQAAMAAGLTDFVTPTPADDEGRISWKVRKWVSTKDDKPVCFLVAYQEENAHFEIIGPEIDISTGSVTGGRPALQRRGAK